MKERLLLAVSWGNFLFFVLLCGLVLSASTGAITPPSAAKIFTDKDFLMFLAISPAVWLVLWIVTGSSRILLWRK